MRPKSCTMMERCICYAPIIGYNQYIRSCSTHRPHTMRPGKEKESDPAVAWPVLQHTLGRPKSGSHQLLAAAFVTGLVVSATRIPCRCGFWPTEPQWSSNSCNRRRIAFVLKILLGWSRRRLCGYSQAMAGGKGKQTYAVQGWQLSRW